VLLLSFVGHAPFSLARRQSLVLQPLPTVVRSLGGRRVVFTRLCRFRQGSARDGYNPGFSPWLVFLVVIRGFWRLRVDGLVFGGGACAARAVTDGGFPADSFLVELFLCLFMCHWTVSFVRILT
jgi:hypothetical protein